MRAEQPRPQGEQPRLSSREIDEKSREFGFEAPLAERNRMSMLARGGAVAVRRWILVAVVALATVIVGVLFVIACGNTPVTSCGWTVPFAVTLLLLYLVFFVSIWWFNAAVPALWENPQHPGVAGQFAAAQRTYPSQDVIFDSEYGKPPPR